jgi:hypothetical protein
MPVLVDWAEGPASTSLPDVQRVLDDTVARVTQAFKETIGLWSGDRYA